MIVRDLKCTRVQTDGQFSDREIQAEMTISYTDRPQLQFKYVGVIGGPLQLVAEPIQTEQPQRQPAPASIPAPITVQVTDPPLPSTSVPHHLPVNVSANHRPDNVSFEQAQPMLLPKHNPDVPTPAPAVTKRRFIMILQFIFIACYGIILIMQIACLGAANWTKSGASTLGNLAESSTIILKVGSLVMILLGVLSLLCSVAIIALGVWILFRKVYHKYSIIKRIFPFSVFPWIIGVLAIDGVLIYSRDFGTTAGFAIAVLVLLIGLTVYADWASTRLIKVATQINPYTMP